MAAKKNNNNETATQTQEQQTQPVKPIEIDEEANRILQQQIARQMNQGQQQATAKKNQKPAEPEKVETSVEAAPTVEEDQKPEIPVRENWELEGIIPFEDFIKMDFPETIEDCSYDLQDLFRRACKSLNIMPIAISMAIGEAEMLKKKPLPKECIRSWGRIIIRGFEYLAQWMSLYAAVVSNRFENKNICIPISKSALESIEALIDKEIEIGEFHPIDEMVLKANGWDKTNLKPATDEREEVENAKERKAIQDMRRLLVLLEKSMIGNQDENDKREIYDNAKQWMESIAVLREYIEVSETK